MNSPCYHHWNRIENSIENMHTDVRCKVYIWKVEYGGSNYLSFSARSSSSFFWISVRVYFASKNIYFASDAHIFFVDSLPFQIWWNFKEFSFVL